MRRETIALDAWLAGLLEEHATPPEIHVTTGFTLGDQEVTLDVEQIRRAMINVIDNACQAMSDGDARERTLSVVGRQAAGRVEIRVRDTGKGISGEDASRMFEPLFTTRKAGVGLGLSIVKRLLEAHGGGVEATSEPGQGTEMCLWLPADAGRAAPQTA